MQKSPSFDRRGTVFASVVLWAGLVLGWPVVHSEATSALAKATRPNVVLIVMDDLNDYVTGLGGHPQARTPHLARLASEGVSFRRAYSNNPICAPSRGSLFSGLYPHTTGLIHFGKWFENQTIINSKLLPEYFRENGYRTLGTGKLLHHYRPNVWEEHGFWPNYGPFAYNGKQMVGHPSVPEPFRSIGGVDGTFAPLSDVPSVPRSADAPGYTGWMDHPRWNQWKPLRYVNENDRDPLPDARCAQWAADKIRELSAQPDGRPFLLGVGFIRPHTPMVAPQRFFDMFPRESIRLPVIKEGDAVDTHYRKLFNPNVKGLKYYRLLKASYPSLKEGLQAYLQAYLACVAFVDEQVGKVIEAVDRSPFRDNTIIVVTSDHGYQMGQKDYIFKNSLWEESTRVPLIIRAPGIAKQGAMVERPVALIDIYPTLVDLCGLKGDTRKNAKGAPLDGFSLRPLLEHPERNQWAGPDAALSVIKAERRSPEKVHQHHYSVRTQRWRYVLYNDGSEELYDHEADPYEWTNLASNAGHRKAKAELRAQLFRMTGRDTARARLRWADPSRNGRFFSKDPSVITLGDRYLLYYSQPPATNPALPPGWAIGIAESRNLLDWRKVGELLPAQECGRKGLCAPDAIVLNGRVHLFYQTYGNGPKDAICHAVSEDGLRFRRDPTNPIFRPTGDWTVGRAIDAHAFPVGDRLLLYFATRDPAMKTQMLGVAGADLHSDFSRGTWKQLCDGPILKPELPWEKRCIEAPTLARRGDTFYMFYAGAYNNEPQQIGVATSRDGIEWKRWSNEPFLPNGAPGAWNSSESGHPGYSQDDDGRSYLFFQGNNDKGRTWFLSFVEIGWNEEGPRIKR